VKELRPSTIAAIAGIVGSLGFLWLFFSGVGYPVGSFSLILSFASLVSAAALIFNSRRTLAVSAAVAAASLGYSMELLIGRHGPAEYLVATITAIYLVIATYAFLRFGKTHYLTPLDMPVYG
jgi:hypothetical protein